MKKTKIIMIVALLIILVATLSGYCYKRAHTAIAPKPRAPKVNTQTASSQSGQKSNEPVEYTGKVHSLNETQIYIELADGSGKAIDINRETPVYKEGQEAKLNLASIKQDMQVKITADGNLKALNIVIIK